MDILKVAFADFWPEWNNENFILPILKKYFEVVIDSNNPDVVFHSIFNRMQDTPRYKCKKVLYLGENWRPQQFGSNYSISFDPHTETNFRLPLWQVYLLLKPELKNRLYNRVNHESFDHFCSFVVSNPNNFMRNGFYHQLSAQNLGKVHSYGRYLTNDMRLIQESSGRYWRDAKYSFFNTYKHKYAIAFENSSYPYYCTEKLMDAFLAGSIPLYWGDPKINEDWNPEAFINVGKIGVDEAIKKIRELETNAEEFDKIYKQDIFTKTQIEIHENNMRVFEEWLIEIIIN